MESTLFQIPIAEIVVLQALEIWADVFCLLLYSAIYLKPVLQKVDFFLKKYILQKLFSMSCIIFCLLSGELLNINQSTAKH